MPLALDRPLRRTRSCCFHSESPVLALSSVHVLFRRKYISASSPKSNIGIVFFLAWDRYRARICASPSACFAMKPVYLDRGARFAFCPVEVESAAPARQPGVSRTLRYADGRSDGVPKRSAIAIRPKSLHQVSLVASLFAATFIRLPAWKALTPPCGRRWYRYRQGMVALPD